MHIQSNIASDGTSGTTKTVTLASPPIAGNVLIASCSFGFSAGSSQPAPAIPSGWSDLGSATGGTITGQCQRSVWKVSDGTETGVSFADPSGFAAVTMISEYSELSSGGPLASVVQRTGSATNWSIATITPAAGNHAAFVAQAIVSPTSSISWSLEKIGGISAAVRRQTNGAVVCDIDDPGTSGASYTFTGTLNTPSPGCGMNSAWVTRRSPRGIVNFQNPGVF